MPSKMSAIGAWFGLLHPWKLDGSGAPLGAAVFDPTNNAVPPLTDINSAGVGTVADGGAPLEGSPIDSAATWAWLGLNVARSYDIASSATPYRVVPIGTKIGGASSTGPALGNSAAAGSPALTSAIDGGSAGILLIDGTLNKATFAGGEGLASPMLSDDSTPVAVPATSSTMAINDFTNTTGVINVGASATLRSIVTTGSSANRVDIIFLGDGYQSSEITTTYTANIQNYLSYIFDDSALTQPFGRYENFFNIYAVDVVSNQSGADDPTAGIVRDTALDASYKGDGVTQRLLTVDQTKTTTVMNNALRNWDETSESVEKNQGLVKNAIIESGYRSPWRVSVDILTR